MAHKHDELGGFLVPNVVYTERPGVIACWCRAIRHPYGWVEFRLADEIVRLAKNGT